MGMYGNCWRITPTDWAELQGLADRQGVMDDGDFFEEYDRIIAGGLERIGNPRHLNLEKEWQALHILLTGKYDAPGSIEPATDPLGRAVLGGSETPFESTYGMVRVLAADEVREVAAALTANPLANLRARFDPTPFAGERIYTYPPADEWGEDEWDLLRYYYDAMTEFYNEAARGGELILQSLN